MIDFMKKLVGALSDSELENLMNNLQKKLKNDVEHACEDVAGALEILASKAALYQQATSGIDNNVPDGLIKEVYSLQEAYISFMEKYANPKD